MHDQERRDELVELRKRVTCLERDNSSLEMRLAVLEQVFEANVRPHPLFSFRSHSNIELETHLLVSSTRRLPFCRCPTNTPLRLLLLSPPTPFFQTPNHHHSFLPSLATLPNPISLANSKLHRRRRGWRRRSGSLGITSSSKLEAQGLGLEGAGKRSWRERWVSREEEEEEEGRVDERVVVSLEFGFSLISLRFCNSRDRSLASFLVLGLG